MYSKKLPALLCSLAAVLVLSLNGVVARHAGDNRDDSPVKAVAEEMESAANALLATVADSPGGIEIAVGYDRKALLHMPFNEPARQNYVYWPYLRKGLPLDFMTAQQKMLTHDLLNKALSAKGYLTTIQIMQLEKILSDNEVIGFPRGPENYTLSIFGNPGTESRWGWRFEGHHLSLNFTLDDGKISVTPAFFGASPARIPTGSLAGYRSQHYIHDAGLALINSMSDTQLSKTVEGGRLPFDILSGTLNKPQATWDDWKTLPRTGISIDTLEPAQKVLAQRVLEEIVTVYRPEIAGSYLGQININDLYFTLMGSTADGEALYWRLDGEDFFYEYDLVQGDGNHVHAVWRSKEGDFGADLLSEHKLNSH